MFGTLDLLLLFRESYDPTVLRLMETVAFIYLLLEALERLFLKGNRVKDMKIPYDTWY